MGALKDMVAAYEQMTQAGESWRPLLDIANQANEAMHRKDEGYRGSVLACKTFGPLIRQTTQMDARWPEDLRPLWDAYGRSCAEAAATVEDIDNWIHGDITDAETPLATLMITCKQTQDASVLLQRGLIKEIKKLVDQIDRQVGGFAT